MPFIFKINVSWKKGDLKSTNISNIFNIFFIFYRNVFALGFLYAILTENVGNNLKKNIGSCLGNPTTKNHFCHIRRAVGAAEEKEGAGKRKFETANQSCQQSEVEDFKIYLYIKFRLDFWDTL